jgi:hypothetical protein
MDYRDLRLDGNAAAGMLGEVFTAEMTSALGECAGCGATNALGAVQLYAQAPGSVMRCPSCEAVLLCVTRIREDLLVDLSGLRYVRIPDRAL